MDQIEFEVIAENTRLLGSHQMQADAEHPNEYPYRVVTEDPDEVGVCHVFEGSLFVRGFHQPPPQAREGLKKVLLEHFDSDAWKYEEQISRLLENVRVAFVGIGKAFEQHHTCRESLERCESNVLKAAPENALVVSTLHDPWQVGLLIATGKCLTGSFGANGKA